MNREAAKEIAASAKNKAFDALSSHFDKANVVESMLLPIELVGDVEFRVIAVIVTVCS